MDNETRIYIDKCLANMDESKRGLTEPMLIEFVWYTSQVASLQKQIDDEGSLVEMEKGGANNRHIELVEHPAVKVVTKYSTQAAGLYSKLMRFLTKAEIDQVDALEDFLRNKA